MLDWLKKLGGGRPFENRVGLEAEALFFLTKDLGVLEKVDADLLNQALRYVLDGIGEDVLTRLSQTNGVSEAFGFAMMMPPTIREDSPRARFFETVRCSNNEFFIR